MPRLPLDQYAREGSIHVAVPIIKGGVPHLTADQVNALLSEDEGERLFVGAFFDLSTCVGPCAEYVDKTQLKDGDGSPLLRFFGYGSSAASYTILLGIKPSSLGSHLINGGGGGGKNSEAQPAAQQGPPAVVYCETDSGRASVTTEGWLRAVSVFKPHLAVTLHNAIDATSLIAPDAAAVLSTSTPSAEEAAKEIPTPHTSSPAAVTSLVTVGKKKTRGTAEKNLTWAGDAIRAVSSLGSSDTSVVVPLSAMICQGTLLTQQQAVATKKDAVEAAASASGNLANPVPPPVHAPMAAKLMPAAIYVDNVNQGEPLEKRFDLLTMASTTTVTSGALVITIAESVAAILQSFINGVHIVDCSFPFLMAAKGHALSLGGVLTIIAQWATPTLHAVGSKRPRKDDSQGSETQPSGLRAPLVLDMRNPQHRLDFSALSSVTAQQGSTQPCACYTCLRHTKGYLFHLINVQEMNSTTLLAIHNLAQVVALCRALRALTNRAGPPTSREAAKAALDTLSTAK